MQRQELQHVQWRRVDESGDEDCRLYRGALQGRESEDLAGVVRVGSSLERIGYVLSHYSNGILCSLIRGKYLGTILDIVIRRNEQGVWSLRGVPQPGLDDLTDLDFGFTPATNWFTLRRLGPELGVRRELPVVWWVLGEEKLMRLPQFYTRRSATTVWYESPLHEYEALLEVSPDGFVRNYPGLWERIEG
jgi:uncharacterized protein